MRLGLAVSVVVSLVLGAPLGAIEGSKAHLLSSYAWHNSAPWFGGLSALEVSPDGRDMTALTDKGIILTGRITRDPVEIQDVQITSKAQILSNKGEVLRGLTGDSEGLAIAKDGTVFIAFEGIHRIARFNRSDNTTNVLLHPDAFKKMAHNGSFEALAIDETGQLYTMPENGLTQDGRIPVYRWNGRRWSQPFTLPKSGDFLPVGADFGPDGRFYLLERATGLLGFRSQLRRWDIIDGQPQNVHVLLRTSSGTHDNLEGVSVWRDEQGLLRATMVADDNFLFIQQTEVVEYALPD